MNKQWKHWQWSLTFKELKIWHPKVDVCENKGIARGLGVKKKNVFQNKHSNMRDWVHICVQISHWKNIKSSGKDKKFLKLWVNLEMTEFNQNRWIILNSQTVL